MTAAFVLHRAARALRTGEIQWAPEWFIAPDGCRCSLGAITYAADPSDPDGDPRFVDPSVRPIATGAALALADYLVDELGAVRAVDPETDEVDVVETVGSWNDQPGRTVSQVIAALDAAAARCSQAVA